MSERSGKSGERTLRRLLPATARQPKPTTETLPSRPSQVVSACTACRKHKVRCNGERPACRRCVRRRVLCEYITAPGETRSQALRRNLDHLKDRTVAYEEVVELLKHLPDDAAQTVFRQIRSGIDVATIVDRIRVGDALIQMAVVPETRLRYEFPYRPDRFGMARKHDPYLNSVVYDATTMNLGQPPPSPPGLDATEVASQYLKPFHAAQVVEPRLTDAKPSLWTSVSRDNALMRELLESLLGCEFQFTAAFQKDYFLEDMCAIRQEFCSSLLVNTVLAYACVCNPRFSNRAEYWNPRTLMYKFLAEAKRLWELEATEPRLTTIHTGIIFSVIHNLCGLDEIGQAYRIQAVALAHQMHLFDSTVGLAHSRSHKGRAYTAWALFNWESLVAFSFNIPPLLTEPPAWLLPNPLEDPQWYGEIFIKYPLAQHLTTSCFSLVFHARCHFRIIMNKFCLKAFAEGSEVSAQDAYELRAQLQEWYDSLPYPLQPKWIVLPGHLQIHMYYYHLLLTMFEPLTDNSTITREPSPEQIVAECNSYMRTLIQLYYLRHGFEAMDLFIVIPLMLMSYKVLDSINDKMPIEELEDARSMLILGAKGLYCQRRNHYLSEALYRVIRGSMRKEEAKLLIESVDLDENEPDSKKVMNQQVRSQWPVSVVKNKEDVNGYKLKNLVEGIEMLDVEDTSPGRDNL